MGPPDQQRQDRERRRQVRGLLLLAAAAFGLLVYRAQAGGVFHAGWWRP